MIKAAINKSQQKIKNLRNLKSGDKKPLLTEETVEHLTSLGELAEYKDAITEAMLKGTKRNVESEDTSKKAVTAE